MLTEDLTPTPSLIVCGDTHLGRGDATTGFGGAPEDFAAFLRQLAERAQLVVVQGDLFDLDRGSFPCAQALEFKAIRSRWAVVERAIEESGIRVLSGNHDRALLGKEFAGARVCERYAVRVGERRVWIEHGERFDAWIKRWRGFTSFVTWVSGRVQRGPFSPLYRMLRWFERTTTGDADGALESRIIGWFRTSPELDILIFGHTHRRYHRNVGGRWLVNPGDTMGSRFRFVELCANAGELRFGSGDGRSALVIDEIIKL